MNAQTKFTHFLLRLINAKKLVSKTVLHPSRSKKFNYPRQLKKYQSDQFLVHKRNVVTFSSTRNASNKHIIFLHGGAYTAAAQRFCRRRWMSLELNRFSLIDRTVFIRFLKAVAQLASRRASSSAIADMFTVQTEFWREMGLFKQRGFDDGFFFIYQVIDG